MTATAPTPIGSFANTTTGPRDVSLDLWTADEKKALQLLAVLVFVANPSADDMLEIGAALRKLRIDSKRWAEQRQFAKQRLNHQLVTRREAESGAQAVERHRKQAREYLAMLEAEAAGNRIDAKKLATLVASLGFTQRLAQHRESIGRRHVIATADMAALEREKQKAEKALADFEADMETHRHRRMREAVMIATDRLNEAAGGKIRIASIEHYAGDLFAWQDDSLTTPTTPVKGDNDE